MNRKVLWAILILCGVTFTLKIGETFGVGFSIGVMLQSNSIASDPSVATIITKLVFPIGVVVYFFLRKRLTGATPCESAPAATMASVTERPEERKKESEEEEKTDSRQEKSE